MKEAKICIYFIVFSVVSFIGIFNSKAQNNVYFENNEDYYDEFYVKLSVENLGYFNIDAIYYDNQVYMPVIGMFNLLKIFVAHSMEIDSVWGYIGNEQNFYKINTITKKFVFRDKMYQATNKQYIKTYNDLFMPILIYEYLFGFKMKFDFRSLTVFLHSDVELPVVKLLRIEKIRENLMSLTGDMPVDTVFYRKHKILSGAVVDWNLSMKQIEESMPSYSMKTNLGSELLGGELNIKTKLDNSENIQMYNQAANWYFVDNDRKYLRQVDIGVINIPLLSQVTTSLLGAKLSNTPTTFRKSYGTFVLQKESKPGWEIELYVNNVLLDFTTADVNGQYKFEIPLVYGNSTIILKHYGPWGEEKIEEYVINIPFIFVPKNKLEYQIYSGFTFDSLAYRFAHGIFSYGINRRATISAGYETFERNKYSRYLPFVRASVIPFNNTIFSYSYIDKAFQQASLMYRMKNNFSIESDYKLYDHKQDAVLTKNKCEAMLSTNIPLSFKKVKGYFKNTYRYNNTIVGGIHIYESNLSLVYRRFNLGMISAMSFKNVDVITAGLNASVFLPNQWSIYAYSFADLKKSSLSNIRLQAQKRFNKNVFASISCNHNFPEKSTMFMANAYIDLNALRSSFSFGLNKKNWFSNQSFSGSLIFSNAVQPVCPTNRYNVGKGIIDVMVFLDINHDSIRQPDEELVADASVGISKGIRVMYNNDTVHRFVSLEPYTKYIVSVKNAGFKSIAWMLDYETIAVYPEPNQIKKIYVPVKPMGEIEGQIIIEDEKGKQKPAPRIIVNIYNNKEVLVHKCLTDKNGYYNYLGLSPGKHNISLDITQLNNLNYYTSNINQEIYINDSYEGDFISDINFVFKRKNDK